jgi:hypothetical protein
VLTHAQIPAIIKVVVKMDTGKLTAMGSFVKIALCIPSDKIKK